MSREIRINAFDMNCVGHLSPGVWTHPRDTSTRYKDLEYWAELAQLLERARRPSFRIWAENSPFDLKDVLKARGYRWNGEGTGSPRAWYIDVDDAAREAEVSFLKTEIYRGEIELLVRRIDAYDRFSDRC